MDLIIDGKDKKWLSLQIDMNRKKYPGEIFGLKFNLPGLKVWNRNFPIDGACISLGAVWGRTTASAAPSSPSSSWERFSVDNNHEEIIRRPNYHGKLFRIWQEQRHGKCPACKLELVERSAHVRSCPFLTHGKMCEWDELVKLI